MEKIIDKKIGRPYSLMEVSERHLKGESFDFLVREFLDEFYLNHDFLHIQEEPLSLETVDNGNVKNAYLAAVAEYLAVKYHLDVPLWVYDKKRFLKEPFFAGGLQKIKPLLLKESPVPFRKRLLFISENALNRA
jgi:hypothetical protein